MIMSINMLYHISNLCCSFVGSVTSFPGCALVILCVSCSAVGHGWGPCVRRPSLTTHLSPPSPPPPLTPGSWSPYGGRHGNQPLRHVQSKLVVVLILVYFSWSVNEVEGCGIPARGYTHHIVFFCQHK